jgi:hypothetical protein
VVPAVWVGLRRLVLFVLGVAVILDGLVGASPNVGQLIVGAVLVGIVPVDEMLSDIGHRRRD